MNETVRTFKMAMANGVSWIATVTTLQMVDEILQIVALCGSITVSLFSIWWIIKQAKSLDKHNKRHKWP